MMEIASASKWIEVSGQAGYAGSGKGAKDQALQINPSESAWLWKREQWVLEGNGNSLSRNDGSVSCDMEKWRGEGKHKRHNDGILGY